MHHSSLDPFVSLCITSYSYKIAIPVHPRSTPMKSPWKTIKKKQKTIFSDEKRPLSLRHLRQNLVLRPGMMRLFQIGRQHLGHHALVHLTKSHHVFGAVLTFLGWSSLKGLNMLPNPVNPQEKVWTCWHIAIAIVYIYIYMEVAWNRDT